jgi:single-strand DNA-binding protein
MELNVKIHSIGETQNVTETFSKREFIVETQEDYKQYLQLQVIKDKCDVLNHFKPGQEVKVHLNLKGRLWTNKEGKEIAFNTLECWKIESTELSVQPPKEEKYSGKKEYSEPLGQKYEEDDLPF